MARPQATKDYKREQDHKRGLSCSPKEHFEGDLHNKEAHELLELLLWLLLLAQLKLTKESKTTMTTKLCNLKAQKTKMTRKDNVERGLGRSGAHLGWAHNGLGDGYLHAYYTYTNNTGAKMSFLAWK